MSKGWSIKKVGEVCTDIKIPYKKAKGWEQWVLLTGDVHSDNPKSDLDLFKFHMSQCKQRSGIWLDMGDFIDGMQGKGDRRSSKSDLKEEVKKTAYLNQLKKFGVDLIEPYMECAAYLGKGNHESGLLKHNEYDITEEIGETLALKGAPTIVGGYRGWVRFHFHRDYKGSGGHVSYNLFHHHGHGGGGPVTKGTLNPVKKAAYLRDADIVVGAHLHERWQFPITQVGVDRFGKEYKREQLHLQLPTYKEEYLNEGNGFHHEKGGPPKPTGAAWLRFYFSPRQQTVKYMAMKADE